jgi:hypothetical protein
MMIRRKFFELTRRAARSFNVAACALALASCATVTRIPYTQQEQTAAVIPGIPGARIWADDPAIATVRRSVVSRVPAKQPVVLALSGGGADGAFGAGLLAGWSARGTRPQFTLVTGASAGALIAPFAFLGPAYDETLRSVFATGEMANLLQSEGLAGLFGTGLFKTEPLRDLIARHVDGSMLAAIAREHRAGRRLYVVTTNLEFTAHRDLGYGRDCCQRRPGGARSVLASTGAQWTSRGRTLREYVASDGNGLQNLIAIISELRRSAGAACGRPVQTYCPIGPLHRSCLASEGVRTGT